MELTITKDNIPCPLIWHRAQCLYQRESTILCTLCIGTESHFWNVIESKKKYGSYVQKRVALVRGRVPACGPLPRMTTPLQLIPRSHLRPNSATPSGIKSDSTRPHDQATTGDTVNTIESTRHFGCTNGNWPDVTTARGMRRTGWRYVLLRSREWK